MRLAWLLATVAAACGTDSETLTLAGHVPTVTSDPPGIDCGYTCAADFARGTHVRLNYPQSGTNTGSCPILGCAVTPSTAAAQPGCLEIVMDGPVTATFSCFAP